MWATRVRNLAGIDNLIILFCIVLAIRWGNSVIEWSILPSNVRSSNLASAEFFP